ncbi:MAG: YebC/PmpR family DNA-binding transcriptional regulator [Deltaproteobacteria bacterium]|nr:YebC/PmpR family DNA-binding transcriptional regulator [Deltaproteobacteria bacterium]
MSGHSRWSTIKHKKGAADAKRGKVFTKVIKELTVAARMGGADADSNPRLRRALDSARANNMPSDTVTRAIKRGTGELEGVNYEEIVYEGYGPGGVAILVDTLTDSKNRTVGEIRQLFTRHNGNMGESGCVGWMFNKRGILTVPKPKATEDRLMEVGLDAGIEEIIDQGENWEVQTAPDKIDVVKKALVAVDIEVTEAKFEKIPQTTVRLEGRPAETMLKLYEALEEHDDVQAVWANFDIPDDVMEGLE